jgi:hypothetical protein
VSEAKKEFLQEGTEGMKKALQKETKGTKEGGIGEAHRTTQAQRPVQERNDCNHDPPAGTVAQAQLDNKSTDFCTALARSSRENFSGLPLMTL